MTVKPNRFTSLLTALAVSVALLGACVPVPLETATGQSPALAAAEEAEAPAEMTASPTLAAPSATLAPPSSTPTAQASPTLTRRAANTRATATPTPTGKAEAAIAVAKAPSATPTKMPAAPKRAATATATVDRHRVVITEDDIAKAIAAGAVSQQGVTVKNLKVRFANGKIRVTADQIGSGLIQLRNLDMTGRLAANNGALSLQVESVSPRGLAANMIPVAANQALAQYASQWYVEDVKILDGRVELRIR